MFATAEETRGDGTGTMNGKNKPWLSEQKNQHGERLEMQLSEKNTMKEMRKWKETFIVILNTKLKKRGKNMQ